MKGLWLDLAFRSNSFKMKGNVNWIIKVEQYLIPLQSTMSELQHMKNIHIKMYKKTHHLAWLVLLDCYHMLNTTVYGALFNLHHNF